VRYVVTCSYEKDDRDQQEETKKSKHLLKIHVGLILRYLDAVAVLRLCSFGVFIEAA
jgi:hypothetical protein